jgi:hypothetical protein
MFGLKCSGYGRIAEDSTLGSGSTSSLRDHTARRSHFRPGNSITLSSLHDVHEIFAKQNLLNLYLVILLKFSIYFANFSQAKFTNIREFSFSFKVSLTRDFWLQVFFINQCPPGLWVSRWDHFKFFQKFAEIFANECLSAVSMTPTKKNTNFEIKFFNIFC